FLRRMPAVDQDKKMNKVFPFSNIIFDYLLPPASAALRYLGKSIPRKINQVPPLFLSIRNAFYLEMIYQLCFAGCSGYFCQLAVVAKHVDQGRFAHITSSDKCKFRPVRPGTLVE